MISRRTHGTETGGRAHFFIRDVSVEVDPTESFEAKIAASPLIRQMAKDLKLVRKLVSEPLSSTSVDNSPGRSGRVDYDTCLYCHKKGLRKVRCPALAVKRNIEDLNIMFHSMHVL